MLKLLFTLTELRYPIVMRAVLIAVTLLGWLASITSGSISLSSVIINLIFTLFALAFLALLDRYYKQVVFALAFLLIALSSFAAVYLNLLNTSPVFQANLLAIILCGLLLGGLGATLAAAFTLLWLVGGELWLAATGTSGSEIVSGVTSNLLIILLGYVIVIFIAEVVRQGLTSLGAERDRLQQALTELEARRQREAELVTQVAEASIELGISSEGQARSAQQQAAAIAQVSSTATQLDHEVARVVNSAEQVSVLADQAATEATATLQLVNDWAASLEQIHQRVITVVEHGDELSEGLRRIDAILDVLISITKESHILSLNAAIEAAAAENTTAGQRFSVVASSIDDLAERASKSAVTVQAIIERIRQAASANASATFESIVEMERGVVLLQSTSERTKQLERMAAATKEAAEVIFASTAEQRQGSQQLASSMQRITSIVQQSAIGEENLARVVVQLRTLVDRMNAADQIASSGSEAEAA